MEAVIDLRKEIDALGALQPVSNRRSSDGIRQRQLRQWLIGDRLVFADWPRLAPPFPAAHGVDAR
jgi:hypothetical protein